MNGSDRGSPWPNAVVACLLILLVGAVIVASIIKYPVDDALKIWGALGSIVGVVTGAVVTYFFSRGTIEAEKKNAAAAQQRASEADAEAAAARARADACLNALRVAERYVSDTERKRMTDRENEILLRTLKID